MEAKKYFKNPYVIIGLICIAYYIYTRNKNKKNKKQEQLKTPPTANLETANFTEVKDEIEKDRFIVGKRLKNDVRVMSNEILMRTIKTNEKMLKRAKMSNDRREKIKEMIKYMKYQYVNRVSNK